MKKFKAILLFALDPLLVSGGLTSAMICVLFFWGKRADLHASDWASWVQAVGSISAILIALALADYQAKQQKKGEMAQEREEARRICLAIRDELTMLRTIYSEGPNVITLRNLAPGEVFDRMLPPVVPSERFQIYRAVIGRLTLIDDDQLRQDIIGAYEWAIGLIHAGLQNNRLLAELRENDASGDGEQYHLRLRQLQASATSMQYICNETIARVTALLLNLDRAIGSY